MSVVEIDIEVEYVTEAAIKTTDIDEDGDNIWIPLSQIQEYNEFLPGRSYTIEILEWLAIEKGLV